MSNVLRGGLNTLSVPGLSGDFKLQLKRPKAKNTQSVPELVAKFGEVKRKMLDLVRENDSLKEQLLKAHETNSLLAQENTLLKQKESQVLDIETTIDQSIEELLFATTDTKSEEKEVEVSKIPRPVRFTLAKKVEPAVVISPELKPVKVEPTMRSEVKQKASSFSIPTPTPITKKENVPSPFEVVDLTLVKKEEKVMPVQVSVPSIKDIIPRAPIIPLEKIEVLQASIPEETPRVVPEIVPAPSVVEENTSTTPTKEKLFTGKAKLEAVNDVIMEDVRKYLLFTSMLPVENRKSKIAEFLNLDIMPKSYISPTKKITEEIQPKDIVGDKVAKLTHLTEAEKARLYNDLNASLEDFYMQNLTSEGVLYI